MSVGARGLRPLSGASDLQLLRALNIAILNCRLNFTSAITIIFTEDPYLMSSKKEITISSRVV
jgi:hypothetical protein